MLRPRLSFVFYLGLLCLGLFVGALLLEFSLRLFIAPPPSIIIENVISDTHKDAFTHDKFTTREDGTLEMDEFADWGLYIYTPTGTRLKKNVKAVVRGHAVAGKDIEIQTNNLGFRYDPLDAKKGDEKRVLVLGDSITLADNVSEEETYTRQAEQFFRKKNQDVKVINAGVGAIDLQNEFSIFMEAGLKAEPDTVVVGLYLNDAHSSPKLQLTRVPSSLQWSYLARTGFRTFDMLRASYANSVVYDSETKNAASLSNNDRYPAEDPNFDRVIQGALRDWGFAWTEKYWEKVLPLVDLFRDVAKEREIKLLFMLFPVRYQVEEFFDDDQPQQRFLQEMEIRNIPALNMLPILREHYEKNKRTLFVDHCHYNTEGYRVVGEALARFLSDHPEFDI